jgi:hypothetical protein
MRTYSLSAIFALSTGVIAQAGDVFEALDFNITEALIHNGVNISAIPELGNFVERTLLSGCSTAVSQLSTQPRFIIFANHYLSASP